jgi:hypothetical protein
MVLGRIDNSAFLRGAKEETELQALQRQNQARINQERFIDATGGMPALPQPQALSQGLTGLNLENFGGQFVNVPVPPPVDPVAKPEPPARPQVQSQVQPQLSFPAVDPNKIALPSVPTGRAAKKNPNYQTLKQQRQDVINQRAYLDDQVSKAAGISLKPGKRQSRGTPKQRALRQFYTSTNFKNFIYQHPQYIDEIKINPEDFMQRYKASQSTRQNQAGLNTGQTTNQNQPQTIVASNTGNTTTAKGSLQIVGQQATGEPEIEDMSVDNIVVKEPEPPAFYQENPTRTGFDLQNYLDQRKLVIDQTNRNVQALTQQANYLRRLAEVERLGGFDPDRYNTKVQQANALAAQALQMRDQGALAANDAEKNIMYLQGMQGLQDLQNGSVNRAAAVWSLASGQNVQINPRSDGRFDVLFNNKPFKTYDMSQLSDTLQLTFSEAFRKSVIDRASQTFEAQLKIAQDSFNNASAEKQERIKGAYDLAKKKYEIDNKIDFKIENDVGYIQRGNFFSILQPEEYEDMNGEEQIRFHEIPVPPPNAFSGNAYKRPEK